MSVTMYKLIAPLVVYRLIQQRLTFVDLGLDPHFARQYRLLKFLYLTFTDAFEFADAEPKLAYDPAVEDWEQRRKEAPAKYWRQGMNLGALDNTIDALLVPGDQPRWKTYVEFEAEFKVENSGTRRAFQTWFDILYGFHPNERPVLWRMLWTQSLIYGKILETQSSESTTKPRLGLGHISPKLPTGNLDWRSSPEETGDEDVLQIPERVAREYLQKRLPEVFGGPPAGVA
jgi:hypothetical protein